jgi:hypothetical protein
MPTKQTKQTASTGGSPTAYRISSKTEGFRRAGRAWSQTPQVVAAAELSEKMLDALDDDPMIRVEPVFGDPDATAGTPAGAE